MALVTRRGVNSGTEYSLGAQIAGFALKEYLGSGGNAEVWRALGATGEVALKILKVRNRNKEPYLRFVSEIETVAKLAADDGVLPILGFSLPERPTRDGPAWLSMPLATPIDRALAEADVGAIVEAVRDMAKTLSRLAEKGIAHRDVKPGNLYRYADRWVVGDFGLVDLPDKAGLTQARGTIGPRGFMPDELYANAAEAKGGPVDVYELAKTLLVLVTRTAFPTQGHVAVNSSRSIGRLIDHPRTGALDDLLDRCTRTEPEERPTMSDVVLDLDAWLSTPEPQPDSLEDATSGFMRAHRGALDERAARRRMTEGFWRAVNHLEREVIFVIQKALTEIQGEAISLGGEESNLRSWCKRRRYLGSRPSLEARQSWVATSIGERPNALSIAAGIGLDLDETGELWMAGGVHYGRNLRAASTRSLQAEGRIVPVESVAQVDLALAELVQDMREAFAQALSGLSQR